MTDPSDWEALVNRCVQMRRDEFLRQFKNLLEQMGLTISTSPGATSSISSWIEQIRKRAIEKYEKRGGDSFVGAE